MPCVKWPPGSGWLLRMSTKAPSRDKVCCHATRPWASSSSSESAGQNLKKRHSRVSRTQRRGETLDDVCDAESVTARPIGKALDPATVSHPSPGWPETFSPPCRPSVEIPQVSCPQASHVGERGSPACPRQSTRFARPRDPEIRPVTFWNGIE